MFIPGLSEEVTGGSVVQFVEVLAFISLGAAAMKVACAHDQDTSAILKRRAAKQL
jgi:hypothetical protein